MPAFNNSPAFGSGGFPSFEEWMRMKNIGSSNEASRGISAISPTLSSLSGPKSPEEEGWKRSDAGWVKGEVVNLNNPSNYSSPASSGGFPSFEEWMRMKNAPQQNQQSVAMDKTFSQISESVRGKNQSIYDILEKNIPTRGLPTPTDRRRRDGGEGGSQELSVSGSNYSSPASSSGGNRPPDLGQSISALEQIIGQTSKGGKMTSKDFALINALENSKQEAQRKAWSDAVVASGGTVVTRPIAGPWGSGGKMVGYD